ncbi:hypothetical protein Tco_0026244, partial [Tanacetum coccineum]
MSTDQEKLFYARRLKEQNDPLRFLETGSKLYLETRQRISRLKEAEKQVINEEEEEIELKKSKLKKKPSLPNFCLHGELKKSKLTEQPSWAPYSLEDLKKILRLSTNDSELYNKTHHRIPYTQERSEAANELKKSKSKKIPAELQYSLDDLKHILTLLRQDSKLYNKTQHRISCIKRRREAAKLKVPAFTKPGTTSTPKAPDNEEEE